MVEFRASEIARAVGGELVGPDVVVDEARHDSREVTGGELFVPLVDERDGHDFITKALEAGAAAYFTAREPQGGTAIRVTEPASALAALGGHARSRLPARVIGVTGSVGKTSCKDLAAAALGARYETHASLRSFNNEYGVPLTLINAPQGTEVTIVEMGARGLGHIARLCEIATPTVGIITTVELVHAELFGSLERVAQAKGELIEHLPANGTAILNGDNPLVAAMARRTRARPLLFGANGEVQARDVKLDGELRPRFELVTPWGNAWVRLGVRGEHQVHNALAAAAAALVNEVSLAETVEGLSRAELSPWRMELSTAPSGALILNDAYNAGPASMEAALRSLAHLRVQRRVAILGPMAELGDHGSHAHRRVAEIAAELGVRLIAVDAPDYDGPTVEHVGDLEDAVAAAGDVGEGDAVLVKGSRVAGLEQVAAALMLR